MQRQVKNHQFNNSSPLRMREVNAPVIQTLERMQTNYESHKNSPLRIIPSATDLKNQNSGLSSPVTRNMNLRTRSNVGMLKSSPLRATDSDFAVALCRETRRVSPGRMPTESEQCESHAAALMTSVSYQYFNHFLLGYDKAKPFRTERTTRKDEARKT